MTQNYFALNSVGQLYFDDSRIILLKNIDGLPSLVTWLRTKSAILLILNNGTVQVNFIEDHTKLIICPLKQAVTFVDTARVFRTYKFSKPEQKGYLEELRPRLEIAKKMLERAVERRGAPGFVGLNGS